MVSSKFLDDRNWFNPVYRSTYKIKMFHEPTMCAHRVVRILSFCYQTNMVYVQSNSNVIFNEAVASRGGMLERLPSRTGNQGGDVFGCLPTGYVKSILYQLWWIDYI